MLSFHEKYKRNDWSQEGEDGVIEEILSRMGITKGVCVEFGSADGKFCSNTRALILKGWKGLMIEASHQQHLAAVNLYRKPSNIQFNQDNPPLPDVVLQNAFVTPENVNRLLPAEIDVLSIDVDSIDYWIWKAYAGKAKVVVIEIDSSMDPLIPITGTKDNGSSYAAMVQLAQVKGYTVLCHCGNLICVDSDYKDLFPEVEGLDPMRDWKLFFNTSWRPK